LRTSSVGSGLPGKNIRLSSGSLSEDDRIFSSSFQGIIVGIPHDWGEKPVHKLAFGDLWSGRTGRGQFMVVFSKYVKMDKTEKLQ
jgi:hypothetical protein